MRSLTIALLVLTASTASGQERPAAETVEVRLSSFDFSPEIIQLRAGEPVVLHLVNTGKSGHNFSAPEFFAAASDVSGPVKNGAVELSGHQSADVRLTPKQGTYGLRCTHSLHAAFGMKGSIIVK